MSVVSESERSKGGVARRSGASAWLRSRIPSAIFIVAVGVAMAAILIQMQGYQPVPTIISGAEYALGDPVSIARTLVWGVPLYVAGLGVALAFRAGMFNLGAEGQIYAGAMAAALTGAYVGPMFAGLHLVLVLLAAAIVGGLIAAALGWLRAAWGVDEVLSTLLSNYIVVLFCAYLATGPLKDPSRQSGTTKMVHDSAMFPELAARTGLTAAVFVVVALGIFVWWLSERSVAGYRWRMTGESPHFAQAVGISVLRSRVLSMVMSGALCGVAGALLVSGSQGRFWTEIGSGIGWDAVLVALIGRARILPTMGWVTIYCVMRGMARGIEQVSTVPAELSLILIGGIIIAASARLGLVRSFEPLRRRLSTARKDGHRGMA